MSICTPEGLAHALDYDVVISCVDRPWPRAVLNAVAYADLIPVIDGGLTLAVFPDGQMRSGSWRVHTLVPERPCMLCTRQLNPTDIQLDRQGLLNLMTRTTSRRRGASLRPGHRMWPPTLPRSARPCSHSSSA